jgi:hypothetical protein
MKTKDEAEEVEELRSRGVEELSCESRDMVPVTSWETAGWLLNSSTSGLTNYRIGGTKRECL